MEALQQKNQENVQNIEALEYSLEVLKISNGKKLLHIYHKIKELLLVRNKKDVLTEDYKIYMAKYSDMIELMRCYYEEHQECLYIQSIQTITFHLIKCLEHCCSDVFTEGTVHNSYPVVYPLFRFHIKKFMELELYKYMSSSQFRFVVFLYIEKFLYSFPFFSYRNNCSIVSKGIICFDFTGVSYSDVDATSLYLLLEDINSVLSVIVPIYIHLLLIYRSSIFQHKLHKIYRLIEHKSCRSLFIENEKDFKEYVRTDSSYSNHTIGKTQPKHLLCDHVDSFILLDLIKQNDVHSKEEHMQANIPISFDDLLIRKHQHFQKIQKQILLFQTKEKNLQKKKQMLQNKKNNLHFLSISDFVKSSKKKVKEIEKKIDVDVFDLSYLREASDRYYELKKEKEKKKKKNENEEYSVCRDLTLKRTNQRNLSTLRKMKKDQPHRELVKNKERVFVDLTKTSHDIIEPCLFKDNLNYIGHVDALLREGQGTTELTRDSNSLGFSLYKETVPYHVNHEMYETPCIEVNEHSVQLRRFHNEK